MWHLLRSLSIQLVAGLKGPNWLYSIWCLVPGLEGLEGWAQLGLSTEAPTCGDPSMVTLGWSDLLESGLLSSQRGSKRPGWKLQSFTWPSLRSPRVLLSHIVLVKQVTETRSKSREGGINLTSWCKEWQRTCDWPQSITLKVFKWKKQSYLPVFFTMWVLWRQDLILCNIASSARRKVSTHDRCQ